MHMLGNGYIEGRELDNFLREFVTSIHEDKVSNCCRIIINLLVAYLNHVCWLASVVHSQWPSLAIDPIFFQIVRQQ
jgi:hypothetical protein